MTVQLHVKNLARCTELKFQFGVPNFKKNVVIRNISEPQLNRKFNNSRWLNREHSKNKSKQR